MEKKILETEREKDLSVLKKEALLRHILIQYFTGKRFDMDLLQFKGVLQGDLFFPYLLIRLCRCSTRQPCTDSFLYSLKAYSVQSQHY